jgi:hypothetical protein
VDEGVEGFKAELLAGLEAWWCGGERVRGCQSKGSNGSSVLPPWAWKEREREAEAVVKANAASWCSRGPLGPDQWAHGRYTDATVRPRDGQFLNWSATIDLIGVQCGD